MLDKQFYTRAISLKRIHYLLLIVIGTMLCINNLSAQRATIQLSKDSILIGDQISLTLEFRLPMEMQMIRLPQLQDSIGKIEILDKTTIDSAKDAHEQIFIQKYTLTAFDSGNYTIPGQLFQYKSGDVMHSIESNPASLYVNTIPVDTAQDFKPIFEIEEEAAPDLWTTVKEHISNYKYWYIIGLAILLLLAAIIYFAIKYYQRAQQQSTIKNVEIPYVKAQRRLLELQQSNTWEAGAYKTYASIISDILKDYLEESYALPANELTTRDLLHTVKKSGELRTIHQELRNVLQLTDLIKFAKLIPQIEDRSELIHLSNKIIDATKPKHSPES